MKIFQTLNALQRLLKSSQDVNLCTKQMCTLFEVYLFRFNVFNHFLTYRLKNMLACREFNSLQKRMV